MTVTVNGQSGSLTNGFTYVVPPTVSSVSPNSGSTAGGTAVTITGTNFAAGATVTFGGTAATNVVVVSSTTDHGHDAGRQCRSGDGDGDESRRAEWKLGERVHLCGHADGEQRVTEQRVDGGWDGGDDHGDELCRGSDGNVWRTAATNVVVVSGTRSRRRRRRSAGAVTVTVTSQRAEWKPDQWIHLRCSADGEQCIAEQRANSRWNGGDDHRDELCAGATVTFGGDSSDERGGGE